MTIRNICREYVQYWCKECNSKESAASMAAQDTVYTVINEIGNWLSSTDLSKGKDKLIKEFYELFK